MMILFLNVNNSTIELYSEEGVVRIPFYQARQLYNHIGNNEVLYITNAVQTTAQEVINMIEGMGIALEKAQPLVQEKKTYIHVAGEEIIPIDDMLRFRGHYDAHPLTPDLIKRIKETPLLQSLIKNKKLELITSSERKSLEEERFRKEDERIGSILVDREELESRREHGDAEEINILGAAPISDSGGMATMSELMNEIEGM